jgi:hypothetical protein
LAELFTGKNPLVPVDDLHAPIELQPIGFVEAENYSVGKTIRNTIASMLEVDYKKRFSIQDALDRFTGIYQEL